MTVAEQFLKWAGGNYEELKRHTVAYCMDQHYTWSEDIFSDTIIKVHDAIERKGGLDDPSPKGMENYFFLSYRNNSTRERQYARVRKRVEFTSDIAKSFEATPTSDEKVMDDLYKDFTVMYLALAAEDASTRGELDPESFRLWRWKTFTPMTYKRLREVTGAKAVRRKVLEVRDWLRSNVSLKEVDNAFDMFIHDNKKIV